MPDSLHYGAVSHFFHGALSRDMRALLKLFNELGEHVATCERWPSSAGDDAPHQHLFERHPVESVMYCIQGSLDLETPKGRVSLDPGEVLIIDKGVPHRHLPIHERSICFGMALGMKAMECEIEGMGCGVFGKIHPEPTRGICRKALRTDDPAERAATIRDALRQVGDEEFHLLPLPSAPLVRMRRAIWSRLSAGIDGEQVLAASGVSRSKALKLFRQTYGKTPRSLLEEFRLSLAEEQLRKGASIKETAAHCGYSSADVFTRSWKRQHGCSPAEWQDRLRAEGGEANR